MTISSSAHKDNMPLFNSYQDTLETVYKDGNLLVDPSFQQIRDRVREFQNF